MEIKTIPAEKAIVKTVRTSLSHIAEAIGDWPTRIWKEVSEHGLQVVGAPVYVYKGCGEDPNQEFELRMCLPVKKHGAYAGEFEKTELKEYRCVETLYVGTMPDLGVKGWGAFMEEAISQKLSIGEESREVYVQWVDFHSPQNQVLLQMEVK